MPGAPQVALNAKFVPYIVRLTGYWPVAILLISTVLVFDKMIYGTAILCFGVLIQLIIQRNTLLRARTYMVGLLDTAIALAIIIELYAWWQSSLRFNSNPFLLLVLHAVFAFWFVRMTFQQKALRRAVCWSLTILGAYWAFLTIRKAFNMFEVITAHGFADLSQFRNAYSPYVASNEWVLVLIMLLPFPAILALTSKRTWVGIAAASVVILIAYCILLSFSRGGYIALLLYTCIAGAGILLFDRSYIKRFSLVILFGALVLTSASVPHWSAIRTTIMMGETVSQQRSTESRWRMWNVGKTTLQSEPWFGVGAYNYALKYNVSHQRDPYETPLGRVTSVVTQLLTEKGITGIVMPFGILLFIFISASRMFFFRKTGAESDTLFIILALAALAGICVRELTVSTLLFRDFIFHLFCIFMGLVLSDVEKTWKQFSASRLKMGILLFPFVCLSLLVLYHWHTDRNIQKHQNAVVKALNESSYAKAIHLGKKVSRLLPEHPVPYIHLATALAHHTPEEPVSWNTIFNCTGNVDSALMQLKTAASIEPRDETILLALGWLYACNSELNLAKDHVIRAYQIDSTLGIYPLTIGMILEHQGDTLIAEEYYARALALDPDLFLSRFWHAHFGRDTQRTEALLQRALTSIDSNTSNPIALARRGTLYYFSNETSKAADCLWRALEALPGMNRPYFYLGAMALASGDTVSGLSLWDKSAFLDPFDQMVNYQYGILLSAKDPVLAGTFLRKTLSVRKSEPVYQKRRIFYPKIPLYHNTIISRAVLDYFDPEVPLDEIQQYLE